MTKILIKTYTVDLSHDLVPNIALQRKFLFSISFTNS